MNGKPELQFMGYKRGREIHLPDLIQSEIRFCA
jgi:hypothetical protein